MTRARQQSLDPMLEPKHRIVAIGLLRLDPPDEISSHISELLGLHQPPAIQRKAIELASNLSGSNIAEPILLGLRRLNPRLRMAALQVLLQRLNWTQQLMDRVESGDINPVLIDASSRQRLVRHRDKTIQARSRRIFKLDSSSDRTELVDRYLRAIEQTKGNVDRGRVLFRKSCVACHRLENQGNEIGPNLAAFANRGVAAMVTNILDPNREVDPRYLSYQLQLHDGRTLLGVIANETATAITLQDAEGKAVTILRQEIEAMRSTTLSLMPENFENDIGPAAMADLIEYLVSRGR